MTLHHLINPMDSYHSVKVNKNLLKTKGVSSYETTIKQQEQTLGKHHCLWPLTWNLSLHWLLLITMADKGNWVLAGKTFISVMMSFLVKLWAASVVIGLFAFFYDPKICSINQKLMAEVAVFMFSDKLLYVQSFYTVCVFLSVKD